MAIQKNLFEQKIEVDERLMQFLIACRREFGSKVRSTRGINALFSQSKIKPTLLETKKMHAVFVSDTSLMALSDADREKIYASVPSNSRRFTTYAHTFCKLAADAGFYVNRSQAQELSDRWNIIIRGGTRTHRNDKQYTGEDKFPKVIEKATYKKSASTKLNPNANFLADILSDHFSVSKTNLVNAALVFMAREVRFGRGDDILDALEFQLPHVRALASTLSCRERHVDKREMKDKLMKFITNYDL
ncbi:hypothetical protein ICN48_06210 [Polynucleobacter sp. JS-Safj-400b-B2]|uniref:hypothetical protein n=1 Tax=Polynucleobacter sp. JS-Safj-400b-B2 TaxID=2576921 RepID=UPI001C0BBD05|nr:hypothetical protein [Polynucleobacter sp. JS-Safj-400b-B2]MBU3625825.1 hypothetical protein [Polynucleobacter sp. JS-Safj-400b-B2]